MQIIHYQNHLIMLKFYAKFEQPTIVKYAQPFRNGIQSNTTQRHGIGYVLRGTKYVYYGDVRCEVKRGDVFYVSAGHQYIEDIPDGDKPFEQIIFYYDNQSLNTILHQLSINYQLNINNSHSCPNCKDQQTVIYPAWSTLKNFYHTINQYIKDDLFGQDDAAEKLKMTELLYLILSNDDCCIKNKILSNVDTANENFEEIINKYVFEDITLQELSEKCGMSLTSFKKDFRRCFHESPHKWFNKQRLTKARLLLISTNRSIADIGTESNFPNTSHFIKLFRKEFRITPATYRKAHINGRLDESIMRKNQPIHDVSLLDDLSENRDEIGVMQQ